ncbi:unnamed protein product [Brachionus calyciflorus]|uniref:c-SKI SMAD4-binding domain-containing protein n=1 Tax=Brachionus calyciflorus TaxID=104777 RepID=A0A813TLH7_9BILA|nr:unnamed protein product [Brachionus calyciflorus]
MESENKISTVFIRGLSMISLKIDGKDRVCLAQLSNSLLKKYSYNEIHNRRVALGINCVQCTTSQLEILRNAGAMPASSRRCGMITKKEAERLVKSFLDETKPPNLPETFSFKVEHKCEYGCQGVFYPSRYNSSRAKCIRCAHCNMFFSPNKFIFHSHERPNIKFQPTGNVNFNSWRKHIVLINKDDDEQLNSAWEDVKSIFNSGKRKRGNMEEETDNESNLNYSFDEMTETESKFSEKNETKYQNENLNQVSNNSLNVMSLFSHIYQQNQAYLLPEFLQLNRNFLLQTQMSRLNNSVDFFRNYFLNRMETYEGTSSLGNTANENQIVITNSNPKRIFSIEQYFK